METTYTGQQAHTGRDNTPLNKYELASIKSLVAFTAQDKMVSEDVVREAVISRFGVDDVQQLPAHAFDAVIRFLVDIQVELILH